MIQEEKPLKAGKKLLALLLTVCMLLCMLPTVAFASGSDYLKIAMLDSGRKYFSADWVKAFLYEAKADGYTHVMLAVGNDGMRFLLDDMSLSVGGKTYSSDAVASAIRSGNNAYTTASSGEWTESEMDEFFATAKKAGIEIIPLLNSPGHMDAVLYAASSLLQRLEPHHRRDERHGRPVLAGLPAEVCRLLCGQGLPLFQLRRG